ncbi:MAG: carboxylesterase family protein [Flavobacteriales bacterium]|nr:carboxylesterase family protein [Flavobacteriales bacterium]
MKRSLPLLLLGLPMMVAAQQRYIDEVFTDAQVVITPNVPFGTNIDFLTSNLASPNVPAEVTQLQTLVSTQQPIPAPFFDPTDGSTAVKVRELRMDIYEPDQNVDVVTERPMVLYIHTGNALPPPQNGSPVGTRTDSCAVETCKRMARRGYVAVSMSYRLGWNPLAATEEERRGQLLNAIYRAIHDVRQCVRTHKAEAAGANTYGIDPDKIVVLGEGTGGYIALAHTTLDKGSELFVEKFRPDPFNPNVSYVDTNTVGDLAGFNGQLTLYRPNGFDHATHFCVNMGGALADTTWAEAGDAPMVAFHTVFDPFAPFTYGIVIVPTTGGPVVDVPGSNYFIPWVKDLGNQASFENLSNDPFTARARSLYGQTIDGVTISAGAEGLFPVVRPRWTPPASDEASPWQWWDPNSPAATTVIPGLGITTHQASLASNPDMSGAKGRAYLDTVMGYMTPRIVCALQLGPCALGTPDCLGVIDGPDQPGQPCDDGNANTINDAWTVNCDCVGQPVGIAEPAAASALVIAPNPAIDAVRISSPAGRVLSYTLHTPDGRLVRNSTVNADVILLERGTLDGGAYFITLEFVDGRAVRRIAFN